MGPYGPQPGPVFLKIVFFVGMLRLFPDGQECVNVYGSKSRKYSFPGPWINTAAPGLGPRSGLGPIWAHIFFDFIKNDEFAHKNA